jgi:hypothetical protein
MTRRVTDTGKWFIAVCIMCGAPMGCRVQDNFGTRILMPIRMRTPTRTLMLMQMETLMLMQMETLMLMQMETLETLMLMPMETLMLMPMETLILMLMETLILMPMETLMLMLILTPTQIQIPMRIVRSSLMMTWTLMKTQVWTRKWKFLPVVKARFNSQIQIWKQRCDSQSTSLPATSIMRM